MDRVDQIVAVAVVLAVAASVMAPFAAAQDSSATTYLPLSEENTWTYATPGFPPDFPVVADSVVFRDTLYYVVSFPALPVDTLRIGHEGSVYARFRGRDLLLLDVHGVDGSTYSFPFEYEPDLAYRVTVTRNRSVDVAAGTFENCISFAFDSPMVADEELYITLAPGTGIVAAATAWEDHELWRAEINGVHIPPLDATIPDTLDWHGYFPLEVGNVWEYRYESLFEPGYMRWEIVADSVSAELTGFAVMYSSYDDTRQKKFQSRRFWFYDDARRSAATDLTKALCDLSAAFPIPVHHESILTCGAAGDYSLSGGYVDGIIELGSDRVTYRAWKWFEDVAGGFIVYHGIGVPGWAVEGLTDSAHLTYARLSGVEYGASVVATSTEEREAPSSNEFAASIYPNPFADRFTIETNDRVALPLRFEVIDALGRRVLAGTIDESQTTVDASALAAGFYFVRITDGAQVLATRAVVRTAAR